MFRKKPIREKLNISTAALPDIVFMLLFFFMVTTVLREDTLKVEVEIPAAFKVDILKDQSLTATIYVGTPVASGIQGDEERIQIDDQIVNLNQVGQHILAKRQKLHPRLRSKFKTIIKADKNMKMRLITLIKEELKLVNVRNIHYACLQDHLAI